MRHEVRGRGGGRCEMCGVLCAAHPLLQESAVAKHFVALSTNEVCGAYTGGGEGAGPSRVTDSTRLLIVCCLLNHVEGSDQIWHRQGKHV